jgi:hypothetical protein
MLHIEVRRKRCGTYNVIDGVRVGDAVNVAVGIRVSVALGVGVNVAVALAVNVALGVKVLVEVGVRVAVGALQLPALLALEMAVPSTAVFCPLIVRYH